MRKLPALQFYPGDWAKDPSVRALSYAAKGLWLEMLLLMFESEKRGYLLIGGKSPSNLVLARLSGSGDVTEVERLLKEMDEAGTYSKTPDGVIYNRRMVRDEKKRKCTKERVNRHRSKNSNIECTDVTRDVTQCETSDETHYETTVYEDEVEDEDKKHSGNSGNNDGAAAREERKVTPTAALLAQEFCFLFRGTQASERNTYKVAEVFEELIGKHGADPEAIKRDIHDAKRDRLEPTWDFAKRWKKPAGNGHAGRAKPGGQKFRD